MAVVTRATAPLPGGSPPSITRATVQIGLACDNECVFCAQSTIERERAPRALEDVTTELRLARGRSDEVTLVGGEPTLHPQLPELIAAARSLGFRRVGVQTNGRRLARVVDVLKSAGLTDVHLSIHGATAAAHDYHTGVPGSLAAVVAALSASRAASLPVVVTTVLTRSNARGLGDVARLVAARGASAWCITVPRARGAAAATFDRVIPRLGIAMPFALHAAQLATSLRLPVFVRGAPLCLLGPFAARSMPTAPRAYADACAQCPARPACPGVEPEYLARFAGDELSPRDAVATPDVSDLARMFVGEGEVAGPVGGEIPEAPARARVALPVLGKVRPALAEVSRATEKKSGAALRELFKDLYPGERSAEQPAEEPRD